ncbi:hypothetical protein SRHO_G00205120 [Serrasalmus rhombeus]
MGKRVKESETEQSSRPSEVQERCLARSGSVASTKSTAAEESGWVILRHPTQQIIPLNNIVRKSPQNETRAAEEGLQTQQLLSSAGQLAVRSWRECSSLIGSLSTACWPRSPTPNPSIHVFTLPSLISTQDGTFYSVEEPGQGKRRR